MNEEKKRKEKKRKEKRVNPKCDQKPGIEKEVRRKKRMKLAVGPQRTASHQSPSFSLSPWLHLFIHPSFLLADSHFDRMTQMQCSHGAPHPSRMWKRSQGGGILMLSLTFALVALFLVLLRRLAISLSPHQPTF